MDWGKQCLKPVVREFACIILLLEDVCDDGGYLFCSFLKGALYRIIWCGVNRLGDSGVKVV